MRVGVPPFEGLSWGHYARVIFLRGYEEAICSYVGLHALIRIILIEHFVIVLRHYRANHSRSYTEASLHI